MNTALATRVNAALASLGQQTSRSLQLLCFIPCNATYYFTVLSKLGYISKLLLYSLYYIKNNLQIALSLPELMRAIVK